MADFAGFFPLDDIFYDFGESVFRSTERVSRIGCDEEEEEEEEAGVVLTAVDVWGLVVEKWPAFGLVVD